MSNPFDFFDKIYCISLPEHEERWVQALEEFEKADIVDRVEQIYSPRPHATCKMSGYKYPIGEFGCWMSHGKTIVTAIASGAENVLILEDDVVFVDDVHEVLSQSIADLPDDWDIFFLGGVPTQSMTQSDTSVIKTGKFLTTIGYAVPKRSLLNLYNVWSDITAVRVPLADGVTSRFSQQYNGYAAYPYVCYQRPGFSVIRNQSRNYKKRLDIHWSTHLK